jgi:hypothetical protein
MACIALDGSALKTRGYHHQKNGWYRSSFDWFNFWKKKKKK